MFAPRPNPLALGGCGTERDHAPPTLGDTGPRSAVRTLLFAAGEATPRFGISVGRCAPALLPVGLCTLFIAPEARCAFIGVFGRCAAPFQAGRDPIPYPAFALALPRPAAAIDGRCAALFEAGRDPIPYPALALPRPAVAIEAWLTIGRAKLRGGGAAALVPALAPSRVVIVGFIFSEWTGVMRLIWFGETRIAFRATFREFINVCRETAVKPFGDFMFA